MRKVFLQTLKDFAQKDKKIFLLVADLGVKFFGDFKKIDPRRFINVGIAEANMIDIAAGLAMSGKNVYCYSIIPFLVMRTFEHVRIDLCYNNLNVKLLGTGGGFIYGLEGITHHALEDLAIMRSLPNMTVVAPGDVKETEALARTSIIHQGPIYIRLRRDSEPVVHKDNFKFEIGKGIVVEEGRDICLLASGSMLYPGKGAVEILKSKGLNPALISLHTLKPLDENLIKECSRKYKAIFTLEEHSVIGGFGSAVSEVLVEVRYNGIFKKIGIPDCYSDCIGGPDYLLKKFGLDLKSIANIVLETVKEI